MDTLQAAIVLAKLTVFDKEIELRRTIGENYNKLFDQLDIDRVQQKLNTAPTDAMQAKIFMFFPLFLTVILAPFPAGLVIYWTVNNILTMAQQVFIMKRTTVKTVT